MRPSSDRLLLAAAILLHALAAFALLPPWMGEDEPWQYEYAEQVARGHWPQFGAGVDLTLEDVARRPHTQLQVLRRFPTATEDEIAELQREIMTSMREHGFWRRVDWAQPPGEPRHFGQVQHNMTATNQPPLYYVVTGLWLRLCPWSDHATRLRFARVLSLFAFLGTVALAWRAARLAFPEGPTADLCAVLCAWLPIHARQAAHVNNDVLAKLFATLAFFLALRLLLRGGSFKGWVLVLLACALGVASKTTAAATLGVTALAALLSSRQGLGRRLAVVGLLAAVALTGALLWMRQHNPAVPDSIDTLRERMQTALAIGARHELWRTSVGSFNWNSRALPGVAVLWIGRAAMVLAALSLATFFRPRREAKLALGLALSAVFLQLTLLALRGVSVGRYMLPCVAAFALVLAAGCTQPFPERARPWALRAAIALALVLDALFLAGLLRHEYLEWSA